MIYGTLSLAKQYDKEGKIDQWMQDFLREDGKNLALADGLLLEERHYFGLCEIPIALFSDVKSGAPEYLHAENDIQYFLLFFRCVNRKNFKTIVPPLFPNVSIIIQSLPFSP